MRTARGQREQASRLHIARERLQIRIFTHLGPLVIIQTGTLELAVFQLESQRMNQMQMAAGVRAKAYDVAGVGRYLRLKQDDMKHSQNRHEIHEESPSYLFVDFADFVAIIPEHAHDD